MKNPQKLTFITMYIYRQHNTICDVSRTSKGEMTIPKHFKVCNILFSSLSCIKWKVVFYYKVLFWSKGEFVNIFKILEVTVSNILEEDDISLMIFMT